MSFLQQVSVLLYQGQGANHGRFSQLLSSESGSDWKTFDLPNGPSRRGGSALSSAAERRWPWVRRSMRGCHLQPGSRCDTATAINTQEKKSFQFKCIIVLIQTVKLCSTIKSSSMNINVKSIRKNNMLDVLLSASGQTCDDACLCRDRPLNLFNKENLNTLTQPFPLKSIYFRSVSFNN